MELKQVLTIQEPEEVEELKPIKLDKLLETKGVFEKLETNKAEFFSGFCLLVNGQSVSTLDTYADQNAQVVVLPKLIGG